MHMRRRRAHNHIYLSTRHVAATVGILLAPFIFLLIFARVAHIASGTLIADLLTSSWRLAIAYIISAALAWVCAVLFYRGTRSVIMLPLFDVLQSFPTFAALPLAVLWWGATDFTVIMILVMTIVWPIFFSIVSALKLAKEEWQEAMDIYQCRGFEYVRKYLWPVSIPGLITGSIVGLGEGWEALIATEILVKSHNGLGNFFQQFSTNPSVTAFGILGLLVFIFSINKVLWFPLLNWSHRTMGD